MLGWVFGGRARMGWVSAISVSGRSDRLAALGAPASRGRLNTVLVPGSHALTRHVCLFLGPRRDQSSPESSRNPESEPRPLPAPSVLPFRLPVPARIKNRASETAMRNQPDSSSNPAPGFVYTGTGRWRTASFPCNSGSKQRSGNSTSGRLRCAFFRLTLLHSLWYPLFPITHVDASQTVLHPSMNIPVLQGEKQNKTVGRDSPASWALDSDLGITL